jgi:AcrR family transcriptional regulator/predicted DNA-binding transcriptional regulator AlpA
VSVAETGRRGTSAGNGAALELAAVVAATGVPSATLHHWLALGLLPAPIRLARNRFAYDERHVLAALAVRQLRQRSRLPLRDIAAILPAVLDAMGPQVPDDATWDALVVRQLGRLDPAEPPAHLLATARRLFAEQGHTLVSVDDLCAGAGIAKGSFYRWFASKDEAYVTTVRSIGDCIDAELAVHADGAGVAAAQEALGRAAVPYLALLLEAGSRTMRGDAAVGQALVAALDDMERAFVRVAGWRRPPSRRRLEDILARLVSAAVDAAT